MERLFVYGTLQPSRANASILENIGGSWQRGEVKGHYFHSGWGAATGFPALVLDPSGPSVAGYIFTSERLSSHWPMLDSFEEGYDRIETDVITSEGPLTAWVYQIQPASLPEDLILPSGG